MFCKSLVKVQYHIITEVIIELFALCSGLSSSHLPVDLAPGSAVLPQTFLQTSYLLLCPVTIHWREGRGKEGRGEGEREGGRGGGKREGRGERGREGGRGGGREGGEGGGREGRTVW